MLIVDAKACMPRTSDYESFLTSTKLFFLPTGSLFECHLELVLETPDSGEDFLLFVIIFVITCKGSLKLGWRKIAHFIQKYV